MDGNLGCCSLDSAILGVKFPGGGLLAEREGGERDAWLGGE